MINKKEIVKIILFIIFFFGGVYFFETYRDARIKDCSNLTKVQSYFYESGGKSVVSTLSYIFYVNNKKYKSGYRGSMKKEHFPKLKNYLVLYCPDNPFYSDILLTIEDLKKYNLMHLADSIFFEEDLIEMGLKPNEATSTINP